jgi:hypothetical protein
LTSAAPISETGQPSSLPATPHTQNTEFVGQYQDIELIPVYPGAKPNPERLYRSDVTGNDLLVTVPATITAVLQFYIDRLAENNWLPSGDPLPVPTSTEQAIDVASAIYIWDDPASDSPWHITLTLNIGILTTASGPATSVQLIYKRFPDIGKNLANYPGATNTPTTCSENGVIKLHKADDNYRATVRKSYTTPDSPQQVMDYYRNTLPQYRWFAREDGTYNSLIPTMIDYISFDATLHIKTTADGGGTKVELTVDIQRRPDIPAFD